MELHGARNTGAQYLLEFVYKENPNSFVRSVSHFLDFCLLIAAFVCLTFLIVIMYSRIFRTELIVFKKHAAAQRKFVSVCFLFLPFGEPLNRWAYAMLMYRSFMTPYCIAEPFHKRMSSDNVWLKIHSTCYRR